ncbi:serine threonine protein kinase, CMGC group [Paramyrothecium foliicola]|nr:serine threonine protein kinase, CMGC group [Paramyrothecium foliicola]
MNKEQIRDNALRYSTEFLSFCENWQNRIAALQVQTPDVRYDSEIKALKAALTQAAQATAINPTDEALSDLRAAGRAVDERERQHESSYGNDWAVHEDLLWKECNSFCKELFLRQRLAHRTRSLKSPDNLVHDGAILQHMSDKTEGRDKEDERQLSEAQQPDSSNGAAESSQINRQAPIAAEEKNERPQEDQVYESSKRPNTTELENPAKRPHARRTVTFTDVYQNGQAPTKYRILDKRWGGNKVKWFIFHCDEHNLAFSSKSPLHKGSRHLRKEHYKEMVERSYSWKVVYKHLGIEVTQCTDELARMNNEAIDDSHAQTGTVDRCAHDEQQDQEGSLDTGIDLETVPLADNDSSATQNMTSKEQTRNLERQIRGSGDVTSDVIIVNDSNEEPSDDEADDEESDEDDDWTDQDVPRRLPAQDRPGSTGEPDASCTSGSRESLIVTLRIPLILRHLKAVNPTQPATSADMEDNPADIKREFVAFPIPDPTAIDEDAEMSDSHEHETADAADEFGSRDMATNAVEEIAAGRPQPPPSLNELRTTSQSTAEGQAAGCHTTFSFSPMDEPSIHESDDVFNERYRVIRKLGYGAYSTVWLAKDLRTPLRVALKIHVATIGQAHLATELQIHQTLGATNSHGDYVVTLLDSFLHRSPNGVHVCLVSEVMGPNLTSLVRLSPKCQYGNPWDRRMPKQWAKSVLRNTLLGPQVLHSNSIVHVDLQAGSILCHLQQQFLQNSSEKLTQIPDPPDTLKRLDGKIDLWAPKYLLVPQPLFDPTSEISLSSKLAILEEVRRSLIVHSISSNILSLFYHSPPSIIVTPAGLRAPEAILNAQFDTPNDIWSFGCIMFELITATTLFVVESIEGNRHDETTNDSHLLQMSEIVAPLPEALFNLWSRARAYYGLDRKLLGDFSVDQDSQTSPREGTTLSTNIPRESAHDGDNESHSEISLAEFWDFRSLEERFKSSKPDDIDEAEEKECTRVPLGKKIEEELFPDYVASRYYPARIGEVLGQRYQIVGKLGYGASSTVWLARDFEGHRHVALKLFTNSKSMGKQVDLELSMYKHISASSTNHPGRSAVRQLLDSFDVTGPDGSHRCLVHPPLWESVLTFLYRNPVRRLPAPVLAFVLRRLFLALDFLHTKCQVVHTDIKADNIMLGIDDDSVFQAFEEQELQNPSPRKVIDWREIYQSRELQMPKNWGAPVLCDFGSAVPGNRPRSEDVQPDIYRAPEVILEAPWSYEIDIWNAGCMIWDLFEGGHLFTGNDPESQTYRSRAHLAEIVALLGSPPQALLQSGKSSHKFFTDKGNYCAAIALPDRTSLEDKESNLEGKDRDKFLAMMRKMLQWEPSKRASAKSLAEDEWIMQHM